MNENRRYIYILNNFGQVVLPLRHDNHCSKAIIIEGQFTDRNVSNSEDGEFKETRSRDGFDLSQLIGFKKETHPSPFKMVQEAATNESSTANNAF